MQLMDGVTLITLKIIGVVNVNINLELLDMIGYKQILPIKGKKLLMDKSHTIDSSMEHIIIITFALLIKSCLLDFGSMIGMY